MQRSKFLGLIVDSRECRLSVPADKKVYIRHMIAELLGVHAYAYRRLASVAGMLMSVSAAVYMAPLYIRKLYQSMGGNMDDDTGNPALTREDLYDNIELCDGKTWLRRTEYIHVCGDASTVGWCIYTTWGNAGSRGYVL